MFAGLKRLLPKILLIGLPVGGLLGIGGALWVYFAGPHMYRQINMRTFEAALPGPPPGSLPRSLTPAEQTVSAIAPVPEPTPEALERGRVYYSYYCTFCHGQQGRGDGPVGASYVPSPPDFHALSLVGYDEAKLRTAMLRGKGHAPVLERVVPPAAIPFLSLYVRHLAEP